MKNSGLRRRDHQGSTLPRSVFQHHVYSYNLTKSRGGQALGASKFLTASTLYERRRNPSRQPRKPSLHTAGRQERTQVVVLLVLENISNGILYLRAIRKNPQHSASTRVCMMGHAKQRSPSPPHLLSLSPAGTRGQQRRTPGYMGGLVGKHAGSIQQSDTVW